jgi:hypothetical protein
MRRNGNQDSKLTALSCRMSMAGRQRHCKTVSKLQTVPAIGSNH